jgi:hypothetical protein
MEMKQYPGLSPLSEVPEVCEEGHLWLQELIDGGQLRFRLAESGVLEFGDSRETYVPGNEPLAYGHAVRHVRERFDREAFQAAAAAPGEYVFFAEATRLESVDYDWSRMPPVLGFDVWDGAAGRFLPVDEVERAFDRLGLAPVNSFRKELPARDFQPERYDIPESNWYDGPAAGVVIRNRDGRRAVCHNPAAGTAARPAEGESEKEGEGEPTTLAERFVTERQLERAIDALEASGQGVTTGRAIEYVLEQVVREQYGRLFGDDPVDARALRSAVATRVSRLLE